jgi:hypothetical protein
MKPDHAIRLRGGWERHDPSGEGWSDHACRLALPLAWAAADPPRVRLVRHFQAPPIDPLRETLGLQLDDVPGLTAVELNGQCLARPDPATRSLWLPLPVPLPSRNRLVLDVATPGHEIDSATKCLWGQVALVVRPRDTGPTGV